MKRVLSFIFVAVMLITAVPFAVVADEVSRVGSTGDDVVRLQSRLIELGFLYGEADGHFGEMTKSAVIAFQEHLVSLGREVDVDGIAGRQTKEYLYADNEALEAPDLMTGSQGERVKLLQQRLMALNLLDGSIDGVYGNQTRSAVAEFQEAMAEAGLEAVAQIGVADRYTLETIYDVPDSVRKKLPAGFSASDPLSLTTRALYATNAILMNADTGEVLFEKNADDRSYPASTTKIMTLLLALENGDISSTITVPKSAGDVPWDSSVVPVYAGEVMPFRDLLYGLMIKSGNDAANAIATLVSGDVSSFVNAMNAKAQSLGMTGTHYANPHGYDDNEHYTTARDMGLLTCAALRNSEFKTIVSTRTYVMSATKNRKALTLNNSYSILNSSSSNYYPYAYGIKTGYTSVAGQCYVGAAEKDGINLVAVVLHSGLVREYKWQDAAKLFNYGFALLEQ
ncbi:MAG: peptidoglycan-binding protein [Clostridia bacterium]|nr:peptidoglycan-binding protein [Clostridia bacterium]